MNPSHAGAGRKKIAVIFCLLALLIVTCLLFGSCGDNKTPDTPDKPDTGDVTPTPDDTEKPDDTDKPDPKPEEPKQEFTLAFMIDGKIYKTFKVKAGDTFTDIPALPEVPGYIGSWGKYSHKDFENIQGNMIIEGDYTRATYTLTFDYAGATEGAETASTEITYNDPFGTLPTPKKDGYTFDAWYIGEDRINRYDIWRYTENKTATAHFVDYYSEGLEYEKIYGENVCWVTGIGTCTDTDIVVPATYRGDPVIGIKSPAFENNTQITSVCLGENVYILDSSVFKGCTSLRSVTFLHTAGLPEGYTPNSYGRDAFSGCTALEDLTVPTYILELIRGNNFDNLKHLTTTAGDTFPFLGKWHTLETVVINEGVRTMEYGTFCCNLNSSSAVSCLSSVTLPESLTEIPEKAFFGCRALTSVKIGKNVTSIGAAAFGDTAENLVIELSPENTFFTYKDGCLVEKASGTLLVLKGNYVLPTDGSLKVISGGVFSGFDLTEILIPASVTTIESGAFAGCRNLKKFTVEDGSLLTVIGDHAFERIPEIAKVPLAVASFFTNGTKELTVIGSGVFDTNFSGFDVRIERLILGDGITSVGAGVLSGCKTIQYVKLGSGITSIGEKAFAYSSLSEIDLSEGLLTIGASAFEQCYSLREITIPSSVTSIDTNAFFMDKNNGTSVLSRVNISDIEKWASISFANTYANPLFTGHRLYKDGYEVTSVTFATLTKIADYAFYGCRSLRSVYFETTVQEIGKYAFTSCINLRTADFMRSEGETNPLVLDEGAFWYCRALPGITRAVNLTKVGAKVFAYCYSMVEFTIPASVTEFSRDAFYNNDNLKEVTNLSSAVNGSVFGDKLLAEGTESKIIRKDHTIFYNQNGTYYLIGTDAGGQLADFYTLPNDINGNPYTVAAYAFVGTAFKNITIPSTAQITRIQGYAFAGSDIRTLTVYLALDNYSNSLCYACENLREVTLTGGSVPEHAFDSCTSLTNLNLDNVTRIRQSAFAGCTSLAEVILPPTLESFGTDGDQFENCTALTKVVISEGFTSLPSYMFYGCTSLAEVTLPSTITSIGYSAFSGAGRATTGLHIYFAGTEDAWNAISGLNNAALPKNVTYHFESTGPEDTEA